MNKLIINVNSFRKNILSAKKNGDKICAVVKANAYGHGVENVVPFVEDIVEYFAVANVQEGVCARKYTYRPILVLGAFNSADLADIVRNKLTLSIYNFECLKALEGLKSNINVHIKVNSGMNRLGFVQEDIAKLKHILGKNKNIKVVGIYSHIFDNNQANILKQKKVYDQFVESYFDGKVPQEIITHLSATGGKECLRGKYKMIRLGLGLYGYPDGAKALSIYSKVVAINKVHIGDKVGYDGIYQAKNEERIAVIPLGYYDGVPLNFYQGGYVIAGEKKYRVVGKTCMDMFMVKVDEKVRVGDIVKVFWDAKLWAKIKGTHEWEILTSLKSNRLKVVLK